MRSPHSGIPVSSGVHSLRRKGRSSRRIDVDATSACTFLRAARDVLEDCDLRLQVHPLPANNPAERGALDHDDDIRVEAYERELDAACRFPLPASVSLLSAMYSKWGTIPRSSPRTFGQLHQWAELLADRSSIGEEDASLEGHPQSARERFVLGRIG